MIKLRVPAVFNKDYIDKLDILNKKYKNSRIVETYGSLQFDGIGSSRAGFQLPHISYQELEEYIAYSKEKGIDFNYTMNTTCHGDYSQNELNVVIKDQIEKLIAVGVNNFTVSTPYLIQFLRCNYPKINVVASINMCTSSVSQVLQLKDMGIDRVVLDRNVNKNFKLLKAIKIGGGIDIELLTNSLCLPFCIMHQYHNNLNSHYSKTKDTDLVQCYPYAQCFSSYIENPILMICSGWIRPEDLNKYVNLGIDMFKIDGRGIPSDILMDIIEPYMSEKYEGNVFDLMFSGRNTRRSISAYLNNRELDDFLDFIIDKDIDCRYCGGQNKKCREIATEISFDEEKRKNFLKKQKHDISKVFSVKN